jgi:plastocyanin
MQGKGGDSNRCLSSVGVAVIAAHALLAAGCTSSVGPEPQDGVTEIRIDNLSFDPLEVTITQGGTVRWTNLESAPIPHTVTSGSPDDADVGELFESGILNPGDAPFEHQFNDVGGFLYYCRVHPTTPGMINAKVTVTAP